MIFSCGLSFHLFFRVICLLNKYLGFRAHCAEATVLDPEDTIVEKLDGNSCHRQLVLWEESMAVNKMRK